MSIFRTFFTTSPVAQLTKRFVVLASLGGALVMALPMLSFAQANSGLTIFSGVDNRKDILDYYLQFNGVSGQRDRYKLYIPAKKMSQGAKVLYVSYPEHFDGSFDVDKVRVETKSQGRLEIEDVLWDQESRFLQIVLDEPVEPNQRVTITLSNVTNPSLGTYYMVADAMVAGDIPVRVYLGTWIVSIN